MKRRICLLLIFLALGMITPGEANEQKVGRYFPVGGGYVWDFAGEGIEFAEFIKKVEYLQGNRVQLSRWDGGTRLMQIYEITPSAIIRTFSRAEVYDNPKYFQEPANQATVILQTPLAVGTTWENAVDRRTIVSTTAKVKVPAGEFKSVIVVKITSLVSEIMDNSYTLEYYAADTGLILQEYFGLNDFKVSSKLKSFNKQKSPE